MRRKNWDTVKGVLLIWLLRRLRFFRFTIRLISVGIVCNSLSFSDNVRKPGRQRPGLTLKRKNVQPFSALIIDDIRTSFNFLLSYCNTPVFVAVSMCLFKVFPPLVVCVFPIFDDFCASDQARTCLAQSIIGSLSGERERRRVVWINQKAWMLSHVWIDVFRYQCSI